MNEKEKKMNGKKKKKNVAGGLGYDPFPPCVSHDTVDCIVTQEGAGAMQAQPHYGWTEPRHG